MGESLLDYVLLALIIAVIIYLLLQIITPRCNSEYMGGTLLSAEKPHAETKSVVLQSVETHNAKIQDAPNSNFFKHVVKPSPRVSFDVPSDALSDVPSIAPAAKSKGTSFDCKVDRMQSDIDRYIGDVVYGDRFRCNEKIEPFSKSEINSYQNEVFGFADNINRSSSQATVDPVDKMNRYILSSAEQGASGKKISDIYDKMTQNDFIQDDFSPNNFGKPSIQKDDYEQNFFEQYVPSNDAGYFQVQKLDRRVDEGYSQSERTQGEHPQSEHMQEVTQENTQNQLNTDDIFSNGMYVKQNDMGNYFTQCNWNVDNCKSSDNGVETGGAFYDNIYASDVNNTGFSDNNMALTY
jgi:hypothetical protein